MRGSRQGAADDVDGVLRLSKQHELRPVLARPEALGGLVNTSRSVTRQILTLVVEPGHPGPQRALAARHRRMVHDVIAYIHALRLHLQTSSDPALMTKLLDAPAATALSSPRFKAGVSASARRRFRSRTPCSCTGSSRSIALHSRSASSTPCKCTRRPSFPSCPTPFSRWTRSGAKSENPFDGGPNDLPLNQISRAIEINLRERLEESDLPPPITPDRYGLLT